MSSIRERVMAGYVVKVSGPWEFVTAQLYEFGEFSPIGLMFNKDGTEFRTYGTLEARLEGVFSNVENDAFVVGLIERRELFQLAEINDEYNEYMDSLYSGHPLEGQTEEEVNGGFVVLY